MRQSETSTTARLAVGVLAVLWLGSHALPAHAELTGAQRQCVSALNKGFATVSSTIAKQHLLCLKSYAKQKGVTDVPACVISDANGKTQAALEKALAADTQRCEGQDDAGVERRPPVGATSAANGNALAASAVSALFETLFGAGITAGVAIAADDPTLAKCQLAVAKAVTKCRTARLKAFNACKVKALKDGADTAEAIAACFGSDPKGKVAKACDDSTAPDKVRSALAKRCGGIDLTAALPVCGATEDIDATHTCLIDDESCQACLATAAVDALGDPCGALVQPACGAELAEITCLSPGDGEMIEIATGNDVTFLGHASDANGVASVTVDGVPASVDVDGNFSASVTTSFGVNLVEVAVTDDRGDVSIAICPFLAADSYAPEGQPLADALSVRLAQNAVDDNNRSGPIDSIADLLHAALNSSALQQSLHSALLAANPLKPSSCDQELCAFGVCACVVSSRVDYLNSNITGLKTVSLALVAGGLRSVSRVNDINIQLRVRGSISGIPYDTTGWVRATYGQVDMTSDLALQASVPRATLRTITVSIGSITLDFSGLDGAILNIIGTLAQGTIRNLLSSLLHDYVRDNFNSVLDGLFSGIDVLLPATFDLGVPGTSITTPIDLAVGATSVDTTSTRVLLGLGTTVTGPNAQALPSLGVALPPGPPLFDGATAGDAAAAIHVGLLNQVLHALWRAGGLSTSIDPQLLGSFPAGTAAAIETRLPPVIAPLGGQRVEIGLGGLAIALIYPGVFDEPVVFDVGARLSADLAATGNALSISGTTIDELHLATSDLLLSPTQHAALTLLVQAFLTNGIAQLVEALPALPLPQLPVPANSIGIPSGNLRLVSPTLSVVPPGHVVVAGNVGLVP